MNILITGASSGIGEALALEYAKNKTNTLFICGRNKQRLNQVKIECEKLGAKVYTKIMDVTDQVKTREWILDCEKKYQLNLVIANAGISCGEEIPENIYNTFNTNIFGVLNTVIPTIEIYKNRKDNKRQIAIVSSLTGYHGLGGAPSYSASKCCVKAYGEALRARHGKEGIKVSVICPGFVRSRITDQNTFTMPFFMEADKAAKLIKTRLKNNVGLISFPWPMRFITWFISILPNCISNFIYSKLPEKN